MTGRIEHCSSTFQVSEVDTLREKNTCCSRRTLVCWLVFQWRLRRATNFILAHTPVTIYCGCKISWRFGKASMAAQVSCA